MQVVQQGEGWYCEYDGRTYPDMVRRYVMQAKCIDASGEATLSVFDDQALPAPAPSTPLEPVLAQTSCGGTPLQLKRCMPFYGTHL